MQGIIIVDKPVDFTSFDVIAKLRGILKTKKIGHSGTLDPMATGVLPIFVGNAAKAVDMQVNHTKVYEAGILFGKKTTTGDITGEVIEEKNVDITKDAFCNALTSFVGEQSQLPPMYSAVKINGQPLYKAARKGIEVTRTPRNITIFSIDYITQVAPNEFKFSVFCSKGTYVRTLCEDIGAFLGAPATLSSLRRTKSGDYGLQNAYTLQQIQEAKDNGTVENLLTSVETVFTHLDSISLNESEKSCLLNGVFLQTTKDNGDYRLNFQNDFLGVGYVEDGVLRSKKMFCERGI